MKVVKKALSIIIWALLGIIILYNIYSFISIKILDKEISTINGYAGLKVISGSMEPTIHVGDMIVIDTKVNEYKEEDIITFKDAKGSFVTHRIIKKTNEGYITKGDNNDSIDQGVITDKDITGKFVFRIKFLGVMLDSLQNPITMILVLIMGIIMCFLISTDKNGIPKDMTEEEKEFIQFLEAKKEVQKMVEQDKVKPKNKSQKNNNSNKVKETEDKKAKQSPTKQKPTKSKSTKKTESKSAKEIVEKKPNKKIASEKEIVKETKTKKKTATKAQPKTTKAKTTTGKKNKQK